MEYVIHFSLRNNKGTQKFIFILESIKVNQVVHDSLKISLISGKNVFVNTKIVHIIEDSNILMYITGSIIQPYNSDIHLNGILTYNDNKDSH